MGCLGCGGRPQRINLPELPITTPQLRADGSIVYPDGEAPDTIQGYSVDPEDPQRLIPDGVGCSWRITGIMLDADGTYKPHHVCRNSECEHSTKPVTFDICGECEFRE